MQQGSLNSRPSLIACSTVSQGRGRSGKESRGNGRRKRGEKLGAAGKGQRSSEEEEAPRCAQLQACQREPLLPYSRDNAVVPVTPCLLQFSILPSFSSLFHLLPGRADIRSKSKDKEGREVCGSNVQQGGAGW
eukprot:763329-Hanusia_phi.AAC.12